MSPTHFVLNGFGRIGAYLRVYMPPSLIAPPPPPPPPLPVDPLFLCHVSFPLPGRLAFRLAWAHPETLSVVHVNDIGAIESAAYLLKYDSVHGTWGPDVEVEGDEIVITDGARTARLTYSRSPTIEGIPLASLACPAVLECTGVFLTRATLAPYFAEGLDTKKVIVSAPVKDPNPVLNIVYGVNHGAYDATSDHIITAASCTTNCIAPVVKVIHEQIGIARGSITTIHNVTNTQTIVDAVNSKKSDLRRARYVCI